MTQFKQPASGPVAWTVEAQRPDVKISPNGAPVEGVTVTFTTADGDTAEVFVPHSSFTADNVRAAILARATTMRDVRNITS